MSEMKYPFEFTINDYVDADFDYRCEVDAWLESNGVIPQITKSFKVIAPIVMEVMQYEVTDGQIVKDEKWPYKPKLTKRMFKVTNHVFPGS